jgi:hypothetical protein
MPIAVEIPFARRTPTNPIAPQLGTGLKPFGEAAPQKPMDLLRVHAQAKHTRSARWRTSLLIDGRLLATGAAFTGTKNPTNIVYFDNVVIGKKYIGPCRL